jgi:hypothetical protein
MNHQQSRVGHSDRARHHVTDRVRPGAVPVTGLPPTWLLDQQLTTVLGPVDTDTAGAISGICEDAISSVLGPVVAGAIGADPRLLTLTAPWVKDLARGLQFQSRYGSREPATAELVTCLAARPLDEGRARRFTEIIDVTTALTLNRVTEHVLGPGASARHPTMNTADAPWLAGLKLGYRIGLVLELLRLSASK